MKERSLDWNLIRNFLAVLDSGTLIGAAEKLGASQPTVGRNIDLLEDATGLVLFTRGRMGMHPTEAALRIAEQARAMSISADRLAMAAADQETRVEGNIRITASEIMANYVLPNILIALRDCEPAIDIEIVATNKITNLLARDADIAIRMARPTQNDLIAKKVNDLAMGAYAHADYLSHRGKPTSVEELTEHTVIGYDRSDLIERGMTQLGYTYERSLFAFRTDHQIVYWEMVKAGAGIGFGPNYVAKQSAQIERIFPDLTLEALPIWMTSHRELRQSAKVRRVYDFLSDAINQLPLDDR